VIKDALIGWRVLSLFSSENYQSHRGVSRNIGVRAGPE
jgi:hypothetical protein